MDTKALKDKILQLAIQGKLVPQDENDEPASVLLERIKEEKEELIKEKVIKKDKLLPDITDDEKLFELPQGWEWVKIYKIAFVTKLAGFEYTKNIAPNLDERGTIKLIKGKNIKNGHLILDCEDKINLDISIELQRSALTKKCLLTPFVGSLGNVAIFNENQRYHLGANVAKIELFNNQEIKILDEYVKYYLLSLFGQRELTKHSKSTAQESISMEAIRDTIIAIPPIEEQKRIVAKVDTLFKLIDELDINKQDLLQNISESRNKVLQLAIQGKLVSQDENDESASVLLKKIKEEKEQLIKDKVIKKEKPLLDITDEENIFELPNGWEWCRLGAISTIKGGKRVPAGYKLLDTPTEYMYLRVSDMKDGTIVDTDIKYISKDIYEKIKNYYIESDDIYITIAGTIGRVGMIPEKYNGANLTENASKIKLYNVNKKYIYRILESNFAQEQIKDRTKKVGQPKLALNQIENLLIPLPPIEEQERIVSKLDTIINYFDTLEKGIN